MIAPQQFGCFPVFGCSATKCEPNPVKYGTGYIPGDVLPAEHLNWFLANDTQGYNLLCTGVSSIEQELATILSCSGCTPDPTSCSQVYNAVMYQINACITACTAPKDHASSATTYGVGNADCYGHLKISDEFSCVLSACSGVAASQYALATAYACLATCGAQLGDTAGCELGWPGLIGCCSTAARSDHVHPYPDRFGVYPNTVGCGGSAAIKELKANQCLVCLCGEMNQYSIDYAGRINRWMSPGWKIAVQCADCATCADRANMSVCAQQLAIIKSGLIACWHFCNNNRCCAFLYNKCNYPLLVQGGAGNDCCQCWSNVIGVCIGACSSSSCRIYLTCFCCCCSASSRPDVSWMSDLNALALY